MLVFEVGEIGESSRNVESRERVRGTAHGTRQYGLKGRNRRCELGEGNGRERERGMRRDVAPEQSEDGRDPTYLTYLHQTRPSYFAQSMQRKRPEEPSASHTTERLLQSDH